MSKELLLRLFRSEHFSDDPFLAIGYLARYSNQIGIHHYLCSRLRQFSYSEIEFYIPQLCHLLVSVNDIESVALEDFIIELCNNSAHGALIAFWLFQTHLHDLAGNPTSSAFKTCREIYNRVQLIVFGSPESSERKRIQENILPVTLLASIIPAGIAAPALARYAGSLAVAQAKKPPKNDITISETPQPSPRLTRSKTTGSSTTRPRKERLSAVKAGNGPAVSQSSPSSPKIRPKSELLTPTVNGDTSMKRSVSSNHLEVVQTGQLNSSSLPDLRLSETSKIKPMPSKSSKKNRNPRPTDPASLSAVQKVQMLRTNYFHSQTQLLSTLENISNKLIGVPKPARLSALRAELGLLNNYLPAEVDIPMISPCSIPEKAGKGPVYPKHHRIVRINPAEATVLNSAERVPYLLMVEILLNDFDFNPDSKENQTLLATLMSEGGSSRRRIFDLSDVSAFSYQQAPQDEGPDSVFEPVQGDIGVSPKLEEFGFDLPPQRHNSDPILSGPRAPIPPRLSGGATASSGSSINTPRSSGFSIPRNGSPNPYKKSSPFSPSRIEQPDLSALAIHMRTAAQMLAQLDASSSKRPRDEVAAIKAKIIASMQSLEEQSFSMEEPVPTFDNILDEPSLAAADGENGNIEQNAAAGNLNVGVGAAKMENDQKLGGIARKADKDDPSAAMFGEDWKTKRERIRKSSPYGLCKNWDLLSVIVKTGGDLRQEAFACQLIQFFGRTWEAAGVPVWVRRMRILVTGESAGIIETIANGVSVHSLKRSLTLASVKSGKNPRGRFATLKDHFVRAFGEPDSAPYKKAVEEFTKSLAAYSIICYVLQLKDRHNGNILIDNEGHIIHIDFGFLLSNSPGSLGFEAAPFKLTYEYVDVLGGQTSPQFEEFRSLCKKAFQAIRKSAENLINLVELMGKESAFPCYGSGVASVSSHLRARFQLQLSEAEAETFVDTDLIAKSLGSYYTRMYDAFQYRTQGIY